MRKREKVIYTNPANEFNMGLFNVVKKDKPPEEPVTNTEEDLQKIKEKVIKSKVEKSEQLGYEKSKKTDFPATSDNLSDNAPTDMKLVKILNEIENLKAKIDEVSKKDVDEIKNVLENIEHLNDIIKEIPKETLAEMHNIKKNMPEMYQGITETTAKHLHATVLGAIDSNILKIIKDSGKINSSDLLEAIEKKKVCSKNTLYSHLSRLEEDGMLIRKRDVHEVYYIVSDSIKDSLGKQETPEPAKEEPKPKKPEPVAEKKEEKPIAKAEPPASSKESKETKKEEPEEEEDESAEEVEARLKAELDNKKEAAKEEKKESKETKKEPAEAKAEHAKAEKADEKDKEEAKEKKAPPHKKAAEKKEEEKK